jgi:RNA polymerase sigma-70 factor (ECF subfamily)
MFPAKDRRFRQWMEEYYPFLFRAAWSLSGSRQDAEELVQDTFEIAWRSFHQLRDPQLARPWLYKILRHEALRHIRARKDTIPWDDEHANLPGADGGAMELRLDLIRALQQLSPIHREILVLYCLEDLDYAQMAEALEIAPGTVMSRLSRARTEVRKFLQHPSDERGTTHAH